ncbi:hypothetical protein [Streptomyces sp. WELS2]|uniref:hypothetical protein n=1 Tax=Streptomyces sp. WELS2 TaxID=2749435 RepID=UPI0015F0211A|nr:hypothetical protein [Streptomyces sp. WELS2]
MTLSKTWWSRVGIAGAGLVVALGGSALPAAAQPLRTTAQPLKAAAAAPTSSVLAPKPTGLAYTYDAATRLVTVTWAPKDPADTVTRYYRTGLCGTGEVPGEPCFVSSRPVTENSFSFTLAPGQAPLGFRVYAVSNVYPYALTASDLLVITG